MTALPDNIPSTWRSRALPGLANLTTIANLNLHQTTKPPSPTLETAMSSPSSLQFSSPSDSISMPPEMPMSADLLAAVGNVIIGSKIAPHHRAILLADPNHGCRPLNGLSTNPATSLRTFKVLDALASLSVSRKQSQVVSIGLQLDSANVTLTIAENDPVSPETVGYVAETWRLLRELAVIYAGERSSRQDAEHLPQSAGLSPPVPRNLGSADDLIARLAFHVYTFTDEKFHRRLNRWWPALRAFTNSCIAAKNHQLNDEETLLRDSVLAFRMGLDALAARSVRWGDVVRRMDTAAECATKLLADRYALESLAHSMQSSFQLRRALEKVTSHHRYFTELVGFAHPPRLHRFFGLVARIAVVPDSFDHVPRFRLPDNHAAWLAVLRETCPDPTEPLAPVAATLQRALGDADQDPSVHSECALVAHYEIHRGEHAHPPPFSYIGVSKLSCMPCHLWLKALAERTGRTYYTRGAHGKWYRGWRAPDVGGDPEAAWETGKTRVLQGMMAVVLRERLRERKGARSGSDSTDASGETVYEVSEKHRAEVEAMLSEGIGKEI